MRVYGRSSGACQPTVSVHRTVTQWSVVASDFPHRVDSGRE